MSAVTLSRVSVVQRAFLGLWGAQLIFAVLCAWRLPLFGDEAFYAWESLHPAWGYSDLPPMTAWAIWLGRQCLPSEFGARLVFLLCGVCVPWLGVAMARCAFGVEAGWRCGLAVLAMPLIWIVPVLALPDALLILLTAACLLLIMRALAHGRWPVLPMGLVLAAGFLTHYRFGVTAAAGFLALTMAREGRQLLWSRGSIGVALVGGCGLIPVLLWNHSHGFAALAFQAAERHPWAFDPSAFRQIGEQLLAVGPTLLPVALLAGARILRDGTLGAVQRFSARAGLLLILAFFFLGFFADVERTRFHWMLPGWLALMVAIAGRRMSARGWALTLLPGMLMAAFTVTMLLRISSPVIWPDWRWYPDNFRGASEVAEAVARVRQPGEMVVADNFMLAAQLAFLLQDPERVVSDSHALNAKHGRARQLEIWGHPQRIAEEIASRRSLLIAVEETSLEVDQRGAHYRTLCERFGGFETVAIVNIDGGRKRVGLMRSGAGRACNWPMQVYAHARMKTGVGLTIDGWIEAPGSPPATLQARSVDGHQWTLSVREGGWSDSPGRHPFESLHDAEAQPTGPLEIHASEEGLLARVPIDYP